MPAGLRHGRVGAMPGDIIPFNRPHLSGKELHNIAAAHQNGMLAGDGVFTKQCHEWLQKRTGCVRALLTHSCTAALEMAALLLEMEPGDEVIMPSFTFVSTANAFVLRGATPVFVDIREDTLNLDETLLEQAITPRTKAIVPVHYAGVACEMDAILEVARRHGLAVVEDAAQGIDALYKGKALGGIGALGAYSFHETKNLISGEGGAVLVNDPAYVERAEILREKGTNRSRFLRGQVDKYTWCDLGSSFLPGEMTAAFLWAQFEYADIIMGQRTALWHHYHIGLKPLEDSGLLRRPYIPPECYHNGHMYYVVLAEGVDRGAVIETLKAEGIQCVFHYVPLHSAPAGQRWARVAGSMIRTDDLSARVLRLPMWIGLTQAQQDRVIERLRDAILRARAPQ